MSDSPLNAALRHFEATEANLVKAEKILADIDAAITKVCQLIDEEIYNAQNL
ncbi:MAG: hypothetical protein HGB11_09220 [Chlorobiales bacterium]|nr:hypothetical protein [Chlorobiales bacterium]